MADGVLILHVETPILHPRRIGTMDLPVARESATNPVIPGEALMGTLRACPKDRKSRPGQQRHGTSLYGNQRPHDAVGSLAHAWITLGDARLIALQIPLLESKRAWVTSPPLLERMRRCVPVASVTRARSEMAPRSSTCEGALAGDDSPDKIDVAGRKHGSGFDVSSDQHPSVTSSDSLALRMLSSAAVGFAHALSFNRETWTADVLVVTNEKLSELASSDVWGSPSIRAACHDRTVQSELVYQECLPTGRLLVAPLYNVGRPTGLPAGQLRDLMDGATLTIGSGARSGYGRLWCRLVCGRKLHSQLTGGDR